MASQSRGSQSLCSLLWETQRRQWSCLWQPWNCTLGVYSKEAYQTNTSRQTLYGIYIKSWETAVKNQFLLIFQFFLFSHYRNFPLELHDTCPHSSDLMPCQFLKISFSTRRRLWWCETLRFYNSVPEDSVLLWYVLQRSMGPLNPSRCRQTVH
jgi:hypothetical protein